MVTTNPDVWAVSVNNLPHDPALARVGNFLASGPKRGIVPAGPGASGALRPTAVPSNKVQVLPFVAVAPSPWAGHFGETYVWRSRTTREVELRAASSGGARTDAIISRIWDSGINNVQPPGEELLAIQVIEDVDPGVESADVLATQKGLDFPFVWHGNVTLPASENTVTAARITDRRYQIGGEVSKDERVRVGDLGPQGLTSRDSTNGQIFPSRGGQHTVFIPEWAGEVRVSFKWLDIQYWQGRNSYGRRFVRMGSGAEAIDTHRYYFDAESKDGLTTAHWEVVDVLAIPAHMRGTSQRFEARAYLGSNADPEVVKMYDYGATILDVEFRETLN